METSTTNALKMKWIMYFDNLQKFFLCEQYLFRSATIEYDILSCLLCLSGSGKILKWIIMFREVLLQQIELYVFVIARSIPFYFGAVNKFVPDIILMNWAYLCLQLLFGKILEIVISIRWHSNFASKHWVQRLN